MPVQTFRETSTQLWDGDGFLTRQETFTAFPTITNFTNADAGQIAGWARSTDGRILFSGQITATAGIAIPVVLFAAIKEWGSFKTMRGLGSIIRAGAFVEPVLLEFDNAAGITLVGPSGIIAADIVTFDNMALWLEPNL